MEYGLVAPVLLLRYSLEKQSGLTIQFGSLGTAVAGTLEARTCSGSSHRIPNELGSPELKPREFPKTLQFP